MPRLTTSELPVTAQPGTHQQVKPSTVLSAGILAGCPADSLGLFKPGEEKATFTPEVTSHHRSSCLSRDILLFQTERVPELSDVGVVIQCLGHGSHLNRAGIPRSQGSLCQNLYPGTPCYQGLISLTGGTEEGALCPGQPWCDAVTEDVGKNTRSYPCLCSSVYLRMLQICKPGSSHAAEYGGSKPMGSKPGTGPKPDHSSTTFPLLQHCEQGGHVKSAAANCPWPDLNPKPCPRLVWKSATGPGPSLCRGLQQPESMDKGALRAGLSHLHLRGPGIRLSCPKALAHFPAAEQARHPSWSNLELSFGRIVDTRQQAGAQSGSFGVF
ncbi:uncharacterized protein LOC113987366 [Pipra filicauda]|uniref:Uncharacterized protein LOC113987366 n=1 Tax=Pipra filicauda TaxID=649802 RepID=A0A7R5K6N9_9PASS|nr:uncharacterized protein LOC113987366 [Pipra filicauda]